MGEYSIGMKGLQHTPVSEKTLIQAAQRGDLEAFNQLILRYQNLLFGIALRLLNDDDVASPSTDFATYIGTLSVLTRALVLGRMVDHFGEVRLSRIGIVLLAAGLFLLPLTTNYATLAVAVALLPLGTAFTFPCVTALLSRVIPATERGLYMGVQQTFGGITRSILPAVMGLAWDHLWTGAAFWIGGTLVAGTLLLGAGMEQYVATDTVVAKG